MKHIITLFFGAVAGLVADGILLWYFAQRAKRPVSPDNAMGEGLAFIALAPIVGLVVMIAFDVYFWNW